MKAIMEDMIYCTGCRACEKVCASKAISMTKNEEGFLYPQIHEEICVDCGKCRRVCPGIIGVEYRQPMKEYAAVHKEKEVLMESSSGGVFTALADMIFEQGGVVAGCIWDKEFYAKQVLVSDRKELSQCRGSKYVQSDTGDTFPQVKKMLQQGVVVLYTGTPCQIAGLKNYLGQDYENLLTADFICHGVPSPELFVQNILWLEKRKGSRILEYRFRSKIGSYQLGLYYYYYHVGAEKAESGSAVLDPYYFSFLNAKTYRESCYQCYYAQEKRISDFTFGDYWSVEKFHPEIKSDRGASILLFNTEKSLTYQKRLEQYMVLFPSKLEWMKQVNYNLNQPAKRPDSRTGIYREIQKMGYGKWADRYCSTMNWKLRYLYGKLPLRLRIRVKMSQKKRL